MNLFIDAPRHLKKKQAHPLRVPFVGSRIPEGYSGSICFVQGPLVAEWDRADAHPADDHFALGLARPER